MRLTKEKLVTLWRIRKQIFNDSRNKQILNRYNEVASLFKSIAECDISYNSEHKTYVLDRTPIILNDGTKPSIDCYFSCKVDEMTANRAFEGLRIMCERFPEKFTDIIIKIGCLLGGFSMDDSHTMKDEYRIISNSPNGSTDDKSLISCGQIRHPSSHFADNNYFFNVILTIKEIANDTFNWEQSKLVLRWPNKSYYTDDEQAEKDQKETLRYRFPYKYFYMWTHNVLHPISLMAYRNLVWQEDVGYKEDSNMGQDFLAFSTENGWSNYSNYIRDMIPEEERDKDFEEVK